MKKNTLYILTIALMLVAMRATAQDIITRDNNIERNPLDNLIVRTAVKQSLFPEERVYLHRSSHRL